LLTLAFLLVPGLRDPERWVEEERREAELLAAAQGNRA
jgi:hypothetical protein